MATLDFSRATTRIDMTDTNIVKFGTVEQKSSSSWSFNNGRSDDLQLNGSGMTFDSAGRALTGTVSSIGIDLGDNDFDNPDILITGVTANASALDDGAAGFWRTALSGNDTIIGPSTGSGQVSRIFGDALSAANSGVGGSDRILLGTDGTTTAGDAWTVGGASGSTVAYRGGNDSITTGDTSYSIVAGDAFAVGKTGTLTGGNDTILVRSTGLPVGGQVSGDATDVSGVVVGGHDTIMATDGSAANIFGDADRIMVDSKGSVRGGNDVLSGGDSYSFIVGDVGFAQGGNVVGGHDLIHGNGGHDYLVGDVDGIGAGYLVTGGSDTLHGGSGDDTLVGDSQSNGVTGGNDRLYGDAGRDKLYGNGGNDLLDGGSGVDAMSGGTGNDTYVVDNDMVYEAAGQGTDTIVTKSASVTLAANVENLTYTGSGNFTGIGTEAANVIKGSSGADQLIGLGGNDRLIGGAHFDVLQGGNGDDVLVGGSGADQLTGDTGWDFASYEGAEAGVAVALDGSLTAIGDAAGDSFSGIESLRGSDHYDYLGGDASGNGLDGGRGNDVLFGFNGTDVLTGGQGADFMSGGAGSDRFVFTATSDSGIDQATRDFISDFTRGQDLIDLMAIDANAQTSANDTFALLAKGTATSAVGTGRIGWYQIDQAGTANDTTILRINNDADAAIDMTIQISGLVSFTAADFVL